MTTYKELLSLVDKAEGNKVIGGCLTVDVSKGLSSSRDNTEILNDFLEMLCHLRGETNMRWVERMGGVNNWEAYGLKEDYQTYNKLLTIGECGPIYGHLWRRFPGSLNPKLAIDQLRDLIESIKADRYAYHKPIISIHPGVCPVKGLDPQGNIRGGKASIMPVVTSWRVIMSRYDTLDMVITLDRVDVITELPGILSQYWLLLTLIASMTGSRCGSMTLQITEVFTEDLDKLEEAKDMDYVVYNIKLLRIISNFNNIDIADIMLT